MILGITSFSTVQFVSQAFQGYVGSDTAATLLFHVTTRNIKFFNFFFRNNVFVIVIFAIALFNGVRMLCCAPQPDALPDLDQEEILDLEGTPLQRAADQQSV